jgi:AraC-like DNA-binding protein
VLERQAEEIGAHLHTIDPVTLDIRRVLAQRLAKGDTQIQDVARALLTYPRSLQRRLAAAGASYQRILDAVRQEAADRYLSGSTLAIGEVAYLLGYSEPATFHRAFKRWKGITPQEFRRVRGSTRFSPLTEPRP